MFKIIEPKDYGYYRARIDFLIELIKLNQDLPLSSEEQACSTFIIGEEKGIIYGGALLQKQHISNLPTQLRASLSSFVLNMESIWVCTPTLCIENPNESSKNTCESSISEEFYKHLIEELNEFGKKKKVNFLCLILNPLESARLKDSEVWSCIYGIDSKKSLDGLFYGILLLSQRKCKQFLQKSLQQGHYFWFSSNIFSSQAFFPFKKEKFLENLAQIGRLKLQAISCLRGSLETIKIFFQRGLPTSQGLKPKLKNSLNYREFLI